MQNSGFFNGDMEYGQEEFNRYFNHLYESGVSIDENGSMTLAVTAGKGKVTVAPGFAILRGFYYYNDAEYEAAIAPDASYSRIDRIVLRANVQTGPIELAVKQGTPGSRPSVPALQRSGNIYEISLARVTVTPAGAISVQDERFDVSVCGAIRPKNLTEYRDMVTEYEKQFRAWFDAQQAKGWRNIYIQANEPEEAVAGSIWIKTS